MIWYLIKYQIFSKVIQISKKADAINSITKKLRKIASEKPMVTKRNKKKDNEKLFDSVTKKIKDSTWRDSANEINADEFEGDSDGE